MSKFPEHDAMTGDSLPLDSSTEASPDTFIATEHPAHPNKCDGKTRRDLDEPWWMGKGKLEALEVLSGKIYEAWQHISHSKPF
jgi:hypothetical protein